MNQITVDISGASRGSVKSYITGFIMAVILTLISFGLVMSHDFSKQTVIIGITAAAVVQALVHLHVFLHLNTSSEARWNVMALFLTILIIFLFTGGTVWIMAHLSTRLS